LETENDRLKKLVKERENEVEWEKKKNAILTQQLMMTMEQNGLGMPKN